MDPAEPDRLTPFLGSLQALQDLLAVFHERGVIIGGIAASLLGAPRFTADIDAVFLLRLEEIPQLLHEAAKLELVPRISNPEEFAKKNRVILLRHTASGINIDLSMGLLPFEQEMVERSQVLEVGNLHLRLPTPEDLIIMKAIAHRPKDLADIQAIASNHPTMDTQRIHDWVDQFAEALDMPGLCKEISQFL